MGRALARLGIEHIPAYSPQARGRSERMFGTLQDRLPKELSLLGIRDIDEAMAHIRSGAANVAFLMNSARMSQVRDIAFAGEVLPQKSTDFYPKLLTGLTIYALE